MSSDEPQDQALMAPSSEAEADTLRELCAQLRAYLVSKCLTSQSATAELLADACSTLDAWERRP